MMVHASHPAGTAQAGIPTILGVINVSPESPNRSSVATTPAEAVRLARRHERNGAAIVDVGGRSSSHDSPVISDSEEQRRVLPVIEALKRDGIRVSIDTWSSETALKAMDCGVDFVNFTGETPSLELCESTARKGVPLSLSYMPYGDPYGMRTAPAKLASIEEIVAYFKDQLSGPAGAAGENLIVDPNIGMLHGKIRSNRPLAIAWRVSIISQIWRLLPLGAPVMLALPRRDGEGATTIWAVSILMSGSQYVRTHHPAIIVKTAEVLACLPPGSATPPLHE
jgi:dihydropteroate synthase